jgi:hypothetical protein
VLGADLSDPEGAEFIDENGGTSMLPSRYSRSLSRRCFLVLLRAIGLNFLACQQPEGAATWAKMP